MKQLSDKDHYDSLIRRRIKFVVEKGAMARLFRKGKSAELQEELFQRIKPSDLANIQTKEEYDRWLINTVEMDYWKKYSQNGLKQDRWAYFAKLINIIIYEIVTNLELFNEPDWKRIQSFLHVPIDKTIMRFLNDIDPTFPHSSNVKLKGMTREKYWNIQDDIRRLANQYGKPPIWFEAAWSAE